MATVRLGATNFCARAARKSGLFGHFRSKEALELATVERASTVFANTVLLPASSGDDGLETLWQLCDLWLEHIEKRVFSSGYFFAGTFFQCAKQSGPVPDRIVETSKEWFEALTSAVKRAQKHREIRPDESPKRIARELNGSLLGAYWAHLMGEWFALDEARDGILAIIHSHATTKNPVEAFESVRDFRKYLRKRRS